MPGQDLDLLQRGSLGFMVQFLPAHMMTMDMRYMLL